MLDKLWRYCENETSHGGIVYADTKEEAMQKLHKSYPSITDFEIWKLTEDDFFDRQNPNVWELY
jgi:hypothetical protein